MAYHLLGWVFLIGEAPGLHIARKKEDTVVYQRMLFICKIIMATIK